MNHIFTMPDPFQVPDGTLVSPFLNPGDSESSLPFNMFKGFSIAGGRIAPGISSKIQISPFVTQVTFVQSGILKVWMKEINNEEPYPLEVIPNQAVLTRPGTFLQLVNNDKNAPCDVLYIVSPGYLYLYDKKTRSVIYDDSSVLDEDWDELRKSDWHPFVDLPNIEQRQAAYNRLASLNKGL